MGCRSGRLEKAVLMHGWSDAGASASLGNMSSLVSMATGSTMPGLSQRMAAPQGGLWDYRLVTEPAWSGEHRKLMGAPFFIRNGRETILMLIPDQLATADSASW